MEGTAIALSRDPSLEVDHLLTPASDHTDCGLSHFSNERVGELLAERAGLDGERAKDVSTMDFGSWAET